MSQLYVDTITEKTLGNGVQIADLVPAAGSVVQVQLGNSITTQGSTSSSFTDTGITVNITPTSSSSKIYVTASVNASGENGQRFGARFVRVDGATSTVIGEANAAGNRTLANAAGVGGGANQMDASLTMQALDTPSTTNTLTYKVQMLSEGSTGYEVNRSWLDADVNSIFRTSSQICVMEIAQ
ncbi:MAG: hypothetical protein ACO23H_17580 [Alphaproteobacteria bacterium]